MENFHGRQIPLNFRGDELPSADGLANFITAYFAGCDDVFDID